MLEMPELLEDPRFCTPEAQGKPENYEAFMQIFLPWCMEHTKEEIMKLGQEKRVLVAPVNNARDLVNDPHMQAREQFIDITHPMVGKVKYPGAPFRASGAPSQINNPAPMLGQHNEEIYGQLGYSKDDQVKLRETGVI